MVHEARVRMRRDGSYAEAVTGQARFIHLSGDHESCMAVLRAESPEQLAGILDRCSHLIDPETDVIDRADAWLVARCGCPTAGSARTIQAMGCSIVWPVITHDGFTHYHIVAPSRTRLEAVLERLDEMGTLHVDRIADVPGDALDVSLSLAGIASRMTRRQLDALRAAIETGYYERPRRTSAKALADKMGVARSTYQEHLRKAELAIMESFASLLADHPALVASATKGPGRPPADRDGPRRGHRHDHRSRT